MKKKLIQFLLCLIANTGFVMAQTQITGIVISEEDNAPVIGATISIKGKGTGTITDQDGKFSIQATENDRLVISYIGMKSKELPARPTMRVFLSSDTQLIEEIVVTAFGQQTKSSFTGSATTIKQEAIEKRQVTNVMDALSGIVSGVQVYKETGKPDETPKIRIRGISSINAGNDPLIVVDGVPYDNEAWNSINPNDVESMTVLKDAASNSLYGARGANGVIMITTKSAKRGDATISFDARIGINNRATKMYDYIKEPGQYYELQHLALNNYYKSQGQSDYNAYMNANQAMYGPTSSGGLGYIVYNVPEGESLIGINGKLNPNATMGRTYYTNSNPEGFMLMPDDWVDAAYRTSIRQEYNISANGGNERGQFYGSIGYLNQEGIVHASSYERYTGRLKASYQLKPWINAGGNIAYTHYINDGVSAEGQTTQFGHLTAIAPIYPLYVRKADGSFYEDINGKVYDYGTGQYEGLNRPTNPNTNALQTDRVNTNNTVGNTLSAQGFTDIQFLKDFKFTFNVTATNREYRRTYAYNPWYGYAASNNGQILKYHYRIFSINTQQILNYNKSIDKHNISAMLGHEAYDYTYEWLYGQRKNMYSFEGNQELAGAITVTENGSAQTKYNTEGFFARVMYDFDQKYFFSGSYRRDGSSRFHPDHRWGNFWSLGASWLMHQEDWFGISWVDLLKVKASYGSQGNDNIGNWRYTDLYNIVDNDGEVGLTFKSKGNPNITWETNGNFNTGIEFELFRKRLNGSIEWFYRKTTDMLSYFNTPISIGYSGYYANIGDMANKGIELDLTGTILQTKDFNWSVNLNLTHYKNKVSYLAEERKGAEVDGYRGYQSGSYFIAEGKPLHTWHLKKFAGINEEGLPTWFQKTDDGDIITDNYSSASYYLSGSALPDIYGGFGTSISWKGIDLSATFAYQIGGKVLDSGYSSAMTPPQGNNAGKNFHKDVLKAWTPENPSGSIARWQYDDTNTGSSSTQWLTKGNYLSLNNVTLGYTMPRKVINNLQMSRMRFTLTCDNVFFLSKRKGLDPRYKIDGSVSASNYAPIRTVSLGVNVQF